LRTDAGTRVNSCRARLRALHTACGYAQNHHPGESSPVSCRVVSCGLCGSNGQLFLRLCRGSCWCALAGRLWDLSTAAYRNRCSIHEPVSFPGRLLQSGSCVGLCQSLCLAASLAHLREACAVGTAPRGSRRCGRGCRPVRCGVWPLFLFSANASRSYHRPWTRLAFTKGRLVCEVISCYTPRSSCPCRRYVGRDCWGRSRLRPAAVLHTNWLLTYP
jgi:hypothetical protein